MSRPTERLVGIVTAALATSGLLTGVAGCAHEAQSSQPPPVSASTTATTVESRAPSAAAGLDEATLAGLLWVREEEQLAHDVYVALGERWGLAVFDRIAASERRHIAAVAGRLARYGIDDPAEGNAAGTFTDPQIQQWYDELIGKGEQTLLDALEVGAIIEEADIVDLRRRAAEASAEDIARVYSNLERGSGNHLAAFTLQLEARGVGYVPTELHPADFDAIVSSGGGGSSGRGR